MTELSPQAQAVKDAVIALYTDQQQIRDWGWRLDAPTVAAALLAAADQVEQRWRGFSHEACQEIRAIAAELEGGND
jgi:hypothetical protein